LWGREGWSVRGETLVNCGELQHVPVVEGAFLLAISIPGGFSSI
jgi:hypothetical protein